MSESNFFKNAISALRRTAQLERLEEESFDCIIIGGGITGAGIANAASASGLRVALVEANDFAAGTSSRSSKLIHGGLRYLAMGDFRLVKESALERKALHKIAPHLAEPHWMVLPAKNKFQFQQYRLGVSVYEKLGAVEKRDQHQNWEANRLLSEIPIFDTTKAPYACAYREYLTDDARLVLANLRKATEDGAVCCNYLSAINLVKEKEKVVGIEALCDISDSKIMIKGKCVINACGPWAEDFCQADQPGSEKRLQLSKGIHIVVPAERLPVPHPLMLTTDDKRPLFAIPKGDATYIGTTDTTYDSSAKYWPDIKLKEVDYILRNCNHYFPDNILEVDDCISAWAGIRPLISKSKSKQKNTKSISRKDEVWISNSGLITIAGGKLTGYRKMAETVLNAIEKTHHFSLDKKVKDETLPGGNIDSDLETTEKGLIDKFSITAPMAERLVRLYGSDAYFILAANKEPVAEELLIAKGELHWAVHMESAHHLTDVVYRRTRSAVFNPTNLTEHLGIVGGYMGQLLGWNKETLEREIADTKRIMVGDKLYL